jgi:2-amino-4-ketopentanoate thiolase beta subunit
MGTPRDKTARKAQIMKRSLGLDYDIFEHPGIGFDYEKMMMDAGYSLKDVQDIQISNSVGNTPMLELKRLSAYARSFSAPGFGARIVLKDEAQNLSGSFKARRAAISVHQAKKLGYKGVVAATSGNYGAAVAALAARAGLKCIIVQEGFDSKGTSQPEIIEKARACEAYGAEVVRLSVGPELFEVFLDILEETGYFNASLYSPYGVMGIETLGLEIARASIRMFKKFPEMVIATNAGGGNLTGTARGLKKEGAIHTEIVGASVDLHGLHMASDADFNRKSFTTGHTGFGIPFTTNPDRSDVPRSAARPLRYMDRYVLVNQGPVFFITEALARLEGLERGPAGNTSLAAAFSLAQDMPEDAVIVVQESEYTGAGKHVSAQVSFAADNGIALLCGDPMTEVPGKTIVFPASAKDIKVKELDMDALRQSYLKRYKGMELGDDDIAWLAEELKVDPARVRTLMEDMT